MIIEPIYNTGINGTGVNPDLNVTANVRMITKNDDGTFMIEEP